jgi:hypothetical protein
VVHVLSRAFSARTLLILVPGLRARLSWLTASDFANSIRYSSTVATGLVGRVATVIASFAINKVRQAPSGTNAALIAGYKSRGPIQTLTVVMGAQKRIRTELKKMAPVLEPKFTNNGLKAV